MRKICSVDQCGKISCARSLCTKHYQRAKKTNELPPIMSKICAISSCGKGIEGRGYCKKHYRAFMKHGDPLFVGVSSAQFTSEMMKAKWKNEDYRKRFSETHSGKNNHLFRDAKKIGTCVICDKKFYYYPSDGVTGIYCSIKCSAKSEDRLEKIRQANLGKRATLETRRKLSLAHIGIQAGEKNPRWKGGISKIGQKLRSSPEYVKWRLSVFERDDYTCQLCNKRGGRLTADHYPFPFSKYPEYRLDIENGRTLCEGCHYHVTFVTKEWRTA